MIIYFIAQKKKLFYLKVIAAVVMQKNKQWSSRDSLCFTKIEKKVSVVQWKKKQFASQMAVYNCQRLSIVWRVLFSKSSD